MTSSIHPPAPGNDENTELASIRFGGNQLLIRGKGTQSHSLLQFLFAAHLHHGDIRDRAPDYQLASDASRKSLHQGSKIRYRGDKAGKLLATLMESVMYDLADHCSAGMMLHAAALSWQGKGVLFPGISGAGKSTLTTWLGSEGFDCLSDEMVFVPKSSVQLDGFNRPLQLKRPLSRPIRETIEQYMENHRLDEDYFENDLGLLIRPEAINPASKYARAEICLIIFPEYHPDSEFSLQEISPAQATMKLMACLINARNLDAHGLTGTSCLSRQIAAYTMRYSDLSAVKEQIFSLFSEQTAGSVPLSAEA